METNEITMDRPVFYMTMFFLLFFAVGFSLLVYENDVQRDKIDSALDLSRYYMNERDSCIGITENIEWAKSVYNNGTGSPYKNNDVNVATGEGEKDV